MMTQRPPKSDPEIAAAIFAADLEAALATDTADRHGWKATRADALTAIIEMSSRPESDERRYFVKLEGHWYDQYPPKVTFVVPDAETGWPEAGAGSVWLPLLDNSNPGIAIHAEYSGFPDQVVRQLVCSSINVDYYWTHQPEMGKVWEQGKTTLMWTLRVVQDELLSTRYRGSHGASDS